MIEKQSTSYAEMWENFSRSDLFLTTSNSTVNKQDMTLIMDSGHGKQVKDRYSKYKVDRSLGLAVDLEAKLVTLEQAMIGVEHIAQWDISDRGVYLYNAYGLVVSVNWPRAKLGLFQTRYENWEKPNLDIIKYSALKLKRWCKKHSDKRVDLPFPEDIEGLNYSKVYKAIKSLPDSVYVWRTNPKQISLF